MIKDSGERTEFETGAVRDMHSGKGRMDLLPWFGIIEVSKHCEEGAAKYGEHNIDKGVPLHSLLDSASRHLAKFIAGMDDEDHLRAAAWNILWALNQRETHPYLNDMPWAKNCVKSEEDCIHWLDSNGNIACGKWRDSCFYNRTNPFMCHLCFAQTKNGSKEPRWYKEDSNGKPSE